MDPDLGVGCLKEKSKVMSMSQSLVLEERMVGRKLFLGPGNIAVLASAPGKLGMHVSTAQNKGW